MINELNNGLMPPQATDLEKAVIGTILVSPNQITEIISILTPDCFYKEAHQKIFQTIISLYDRNYPCDLLSVTEELRVNNQLEAIGGVLFITKLTSEIITSANLEYYAHIIKQKAIARNIITTAYKMVSMAYDESNDIADVIDVFSKEMDVINSSMVKSGRGIDKVLSDVLKEADKRQKQAKEGKVSGIPTGIKKLDKITGGWQPAHLIILASRPSVGKTALMLHIAKSAAMSGVPVCIYSLEMSDISLGNRLLLSVSNIEPYRFQHGYINDNEWQDLEKSANIMWNLPITVDDNSTVSMRYIKSHAQLMQKRGKCGIIFIDYLQLIDTVTDKKNRNREQEIAQASRQAKIIAKELNVPVILLSQLSRECEKRADKTPMLSDLRESGAIEQDADIVQFIYRPAYYNIKEYEVEKQTVSTYGLGILIVDKNRNGATGAIPFRHNPSMTKITDYSTDINEFETVPY